MGGGGGGGSNISPLPMTENYAAKKAGEIGENSWNMTIPMRDAFINKYFMPFLEGNYNPQTMPGFAPQYDMLRGAMEKQFGVARDNVLASSPRGGAQTSALANLEYNRARDTGLGTSQLSSNILSDLWNKSYNTGFVTAPATALQGLGINAADTRSSLNKQQDMALAAQSANAQMDQAASSSKGGGLGLLGAGLGSIMGMATAPFGGTSMLGSGLSSLGSKGGGATQGVTSGLGGYSTLQNQFLGGIG